MKKDYSKIREAYSKAIEKYGVNDTLYTFEMCSNKGIRINGSTIDCIESRYGDIFLVFNENTGEKQLLEEFSIKELSSFYYAVESVFADRVYVLLKEINDGGCSNPEVIGVFSTRKLAKDAFDKQRKKFLDSLSDNEKPETLDLEVDSYTDEKDRFTYYRYAKDNLFSLEITEKEIDEN